MLDIQNIFEKKSELLCSGLFLDKKLIDFYLGQGIEIDFGRKGGAGPLGGRYFLFEDDTLVNIALWDNKNQSHLILRKKEGDSFNITRNKEFYIKLRLVENPLYYDPSYSTTDGIPMKKIALVHGVDCLATTIYQKCVYWACGEACKFCGLELSLTEDATTVEKTPKQINEVIKVAKKENRCSHMTLTTGTDEEPDKGARRYIKTLKGIKSENKDLPLHVQIEPIEDLSYLDELHAAGADTIGIHIEILDEILRKEITPGKSNISKQLFIKNWEHALKVFGKNQVETFVLTGFGISKSKLVNEIENIVSIGVIPFITPVRSIPGRKDLPQTGVDDYMDINIMAAKSMKAQGVNPLNHKAGCVRCGGCSAIKEAYKAI